MNHDFEIRSPQFPYDMSAWCAEKSSNVGEAVSHALDLLDQCDILDGNTREMLRFYLGSSLYDISKLMAFSTGSEWPVDDARDVQDHGYEGYQPIAVKFGILNQTEAAAKLSRLETFSDTLSKLLWGDRSPNRTFIHELLKRTKLDAPIVEKTAKTIELVTMGQLDWKDFYLIMDAELKKLNLNVSIRCE